MHKILREPRDLPLLRAYGEATLTAIFGTLLFFSAFYAFDPDTRHYSNLLWWLGSIVYTLILMKAAGPFILMEHVLLHRKTFHRRFEWLERFMVYFLNPFFGQTFWSYGAHHIGMHHVEENGIDDLSSTERYQRDSFLDFLQYFFTFFVVAGSTLPRYFLQKGRKKLLYRSLLSEGIYFTFMAFFFYLNPVGTLVVFLVPLLVIRFFMISGNWVQHAFINPESRTRPMDYSLVCLDTPYNQICFNDGYHIQHHENPSLHWSELPHAFDKKCEDYLKEGAVLFRGVDYAWIWWKLMRRDYDSLAERLWVTSDGLRGKSRTEFLKSRLAPVSTVPVLTSHISHKV